MEQIFLLIKKTVHDSVHVLLFLSGYTILDNLGQGILKGRSITVLLTYCLTDFGLVCFAINYKFSQQQLILPVKQEVIGTVILPPFILPAWAIATISTTATIPDKSCTNYC